MQTNTENLKLLDGMHEGVLILSKSNNKVIFCNKPAQNLINKFVYSVNSSHKNAESQITGAPTSAAAAATDADQVSYSTKRVLNAAKFLPVKVSEKNIANFYQELLSNSKAQAISLDQIIFSQEDEPQQRNCIYRLRKNVQNLESEDVEFIENYTQIKVKSTEFLQQSATAVYFYDYTNQFKALQLGSKVLEQEQQNHMLSIRQMTLSHEFRTPLSSSLMVLESMLSYQLQDSCRRQILLLISQINLLLCLVNDMLDLKMIELGRFVSRNEVFNASQTFDFILNIFQL